MTTTKDLPSELQAMADIETALKDLSEEERARVMQWAISRFRISKVTPERREVEAGDSNGKTLGSDEYSSLAEFYDAAVPSTESERALVVAYWFQFKEGSADVDSQRINTELKHLGHGVSNITRAFEALKSHKPALMMQTRKEGKTKQARKKYKVTMEGKKHVERMIAGASE
jgi:hypothetical protein